MIIIMLCKILLSISWFVVEMQTKSSIISTRDFTIVVNLSLSSCLSGTSGHFIFVIKRGLTWWTCRVDRCSPWSCPSWGTHTRHPLHLDVKDENILAVRMIKTSARLSICEELVWSHDDWVIWWLNNWMIETSARLPICKKLVWSEDEVNLRPEVPIWQLYLMVAIMIVVFLMLLVMVTMTMTMMKMR